MFMELGSFFFLVLSCDVVLLLLGRSYEFLLMLAWFVGWESPLLGLIALFFLVKLARIVGIFCFLLF